MATGQHFRAFISYAHADTRFAARLQRRLESYRLPKRLTDQLSPLPEDVGNRIGPIFRDREDFSAAEDLSRAVRVALAQSEALVVVASPAAAQSRWVAQEIELFRAIQPDGVVFVALAAGEPATAFPAPLTASGVEPLAADFRPQGDGQRLAFLKLVAGLCALPLDALIQRDAQRRLRRVMAITAGALLFGVGAGALAFVAITARAQAELERNESEAMVEFMLTDLRQKLKAVGRLDIMDAVNVRAMQHYDSMRDLSSMPVATLERRARLLSAMGEDALNKGDRPRAQAIFMQSWRVTADLLRRQPADPDRVFNHAQNEYWLGEVQFEAADKKRTTRHWTEYRVLAGRLALLVPTKIIGHREVGYAEANLCAANWLEPANSGSAVAHCSAAVESMAQVARRAPQDIQAQLDLANALAWLADAQARAGDGEISLSLRQRQHTLAERLSARFPKDARVSQARLQAEIGLGRALAAVGRIVDARAAAVRGLALANDLLAHDPSNARWRKLRSDVLAIAPAR